MSGDGASGEYLSGEVSEALAREVGELDVRVRIKGEEIHLEGNVASDERREQVERVVVRLCPEHRVHNHLEVMPFSGPPGEERLA